MDGRVSRSVGFARSLCTRGEGRCRCGGSWRGGGRCGFGLVGGRSCSGPLSMGGGGGGEGRYWGIAMIGVMDKSLVEVNVCDLVSILDLIDDLMGSGQFAINLAERSPRGKAEPHLLARRSSISGHHTPSEAGVRYGTDLLTCLVKRWEMPLRC